MLLSIIFTTILTVNNAYSTFASPIVSNGNVGAGQSLDATHLLAKRWYPDDQRCKDPARWRRRLCKPLIGDRAWEDQCTGPDGGEIVHWATSLCPENTICADIIRNYQYTIACNDIPAVENVAGPSQQTGVAIFGAVYQPNVQFRESVTLLNDIKAASVYALLEGTSGHYLVTPTTPLLGKVRDTPWYACDYNLTNQNCVPNGRYDLDKGAIIDFTFGTSPGQVVKIYYAIGNGTSG